MSIKEGEPILRLAESPADHLAFGDSCRRYVDWCRDRYADMPWFVEEVFSHQSLDEELKTSATKYGPPNGRALIAEDGRGVLGAGAYRRLDDGACELKRLYVTDGARGLGLGRALLEGLETCARGDGFRAMLLDTGHRMTEAQALYRATGFEVVGPYQAYPERLAAHLVFMGKAL